MGTWGYIIVVNPSPNAWVCRSNYFVKYFVGFNIFIIVVVII